MLVDTVNDTIDHYRTSRPRVGQTLKSPAKEPGLLFMAVGLVAYGICLVSFAQRQVEAGVTAALISLVAMVAGGAWLWKEARRVRKLENDYNAKKAIESVEASASAAQVVDLNQRELANH
ncbi:UsfY protein [Mycobacterium sp. SMC-2]|uniref:UsfY protein n=1 Tax=Mycobacterium sp. SMC-2 TaxID=2857058 RepID=UPI0021B3228E|nr:UsfY protein [Mycobacterium sp. SMC-2]UXA05247.1 UsfY protein [Mycobacterium sp. SMC-2]